MNISLIVPIYNRPAYLRQCFDSLRRSDMSKITNVILIDDCSTDLQTRQLIWDFIAERECIYLRNEVNKGVRGSLLRGYKMAWQLGSDAVINLDSDVIVRNDFVQCLLEAHADLPNEIVTGFCCDTKNRDGSERHKRLEVGRYIKRGSVGGINMIVSQGSYILHIEPALLKHGNWDHAACLSAGCAYSLPVSVIQHIGFESSMGHNEPPDVADTFKQLALNSVTLVCVDDNKIRCMEAIRQSCKDIHFGDVLALTDLKLGSKEAYSKFIIKDLVINTGFALIVQHDGYVKNWQAWTNDFLQYDYIGAPWYYKDGMNVGNGGFSLRSKKLLKLSAEICQETHPEDEKICRTYRKQLEQHGIKFAPESLAAKFSFEGYQQTGMYTNQFGFHGARAFTNVQYRQNPVSAARHLPAKEGFLINQFLGLGDILFCVPLIRKWMADGHDIIWPIADEYIDIKRNFPDIQFVPKSSIKIDYARLDEFIYTNQWGRYRVKQLRWCKSFKPDASDCMTTKYNTYREDWKIWRTLHWQRDEKRERELFEKLNVPLTYELLCDQFGNETDGGRSRRGMPIPEMHQIKMSYVPGFTLLDWAGIIENATVIHAVSSSTLYLFEMLDLKAKEVHLYGRKSGMKDHVYVQDLRTKNYILHA